MATVGDCINAMTAQGLSTEEATGIVEEVRRQRDRLEATGQIDNMEGRVAAILKEQAERTRRSAKAQRRIAALNIVTRDRLSSFIASVKEEGGTTVEALEAQLVGSSKRFTGARDSASRRASSLKGLWAGSMLNELEKAGVADLIAKDRAFADVVMAEMVQPNSTGDTLARSAADIFSRYLEDWRQKLNAYGADIGKLDNYAPQSHDTLKMRRAGESEWTRFISERLDWGRTFPDMPETDIPAALSEVYQTITTGMKKPQQNAREVSPFRAPHNLATSLGHERVLHFKDARGAVEYNQRFGTGGAVQGVFGKMEVYAKRLALMESFGPNPEAMIRNILNAEAENVRLAHGDPNPLRDAWTSDGKGLLARQYKVLSGEAGTPENPTFARIAGTARALVSMSKLGGAVLSSFSDIGLKAAAAYHSGESWLGQWHTGVSMRFERFQSEEKKQLGRQLGIYTQGLLGELYSKFDVQDALSGQVTRWMNSFFRLSGLEGWTEAHRAAYTFHLSSRLAQNVDLAPEALNKNYRAVLEKNGLMRQWDLLKHMAEEVEGERYVIPEKASELTDAQLAPYLPERLRQKPERMTDADYAAAVQQEYGRMRDKLAQDVMGYYADETSYAVLEPDAKTRAAMYRGTKAGSIEGEVLRFALQFKAFPVTYWQRYMTEARWQRAAAQPLGGFRGMLDSRRITADIPGMVHFFLAATALGYVSMMAKDLSKGRTPRDITHNPKEVTLAALLQGGGLGILGDFFLGETDRFGNQAAANFAGPAVTSFSNLLPISGNLARGEWGKAGEGAIRFGMDNTPFVNLFYTRMAVDYLVQYHLREMMSPGTLAKSERKMKKEMNQTYLNIGGIDLTPSHVIQRGGGFK